MGNEVKASVLGVDRHNDLAILNTALNPKDVYSVSGEDAALLDDLMLKLRDIAEKAETFTVLVGCWQ